MFTVGIITSSDKGYRGEREDKSGQVIEEIVSQNGFKVIKEATKSVIEREALGIVEAIRFYSLQITKRAMLSRATSGIRQNTLIINLPGSPKACKEALDFVLDDVKHGIEILLGEAKECARK